MPAAAVIPAPIAYIKVVAVKKLVVGFLVGISMSDCSVQKYLTILLLTWFALQRRPRAQIFYLEKIRVFQAGQAGIH